MPLEVKRILRCSPLSRQFDAEMKIKFRAALMGTSRGLREPNTVRSPPAIHRGWGLVGQRRMQALAVIQGAVLLQAADRHVGRLVIMQIDLRLCDGPPQPLDQDVIQCPAPPVHTALNPRRFQAAGKVAARTTAHPDHCYKSRAGLPAKPAPRPPRQPRPPT